MYVYAFILAASACTYTKFMAMWVLLALGYTLSISQILVM